MRQAFRSRGLLLTSVLCAALAFAASAATAGCADDTGTGGSGGSGGAEGGGGSDPCANELDAEGCFNYDCYVATEEVVSFALDVLPIFEQSCSLSSSCHGNPASPETAAGYQPYLGEVNPETTPSDIALILSTIVDQDSHLATMKIVDPSSPETSFLMHKMDGDLDCPLGCPGDDCADSMPQGVSPLPRATRDTVRNWIAQGAQDN